jgi:hypothetical protein
VRNFFDNNSINNADSIMSYVAVGTAMADILSV